MDMTEAPSEEYEDIYFWLHVMSESPTLRKEFWLNHKCLSVHPLYTWIGLYLLGGPPLDNSLERY